MTEQGYQVEIRVTKGKPGMFTKPLLFGRELSIPDAMAALELFAQAKGVKTE